MLADLPDTMCKADLVGCQLHHISQAYSDYQRRIGNGLQSYPKRAWLLVMEPPTTRSPMRQQLVAEMLSQDRLQLGHTSAKLVRDFLPELQETVSSGEMDPELWRLLFDMGSEMKISQAYIEGANNQLRHHTKKCPHSTLETTSDRFRNRRKLLSGEGKPSGVSGGQLWIPCGCNALVF